jgi:hypothetical protein
VEKAPRLGKGSSLTRLQPASAAAAAAKPAAAPLKKPAPSTQPRKRGQWAIVAGIVAVAIAIGLGLTLRGKPDDTVKVAAPEPRRTVVSAADIAGVEEATPPPAPAPAPVAAEQIPTEEILAPEAVPAAPVIPMLPVTLAVKPWGTVFIDGRERGVSPPLKRLMLPAGTHEVRIVNPVYPAYTTSITVKKNGSATVAHDFGVAPAAP